ncbi:MAG: NADPH:quinone oxidoreductase family protein [Dehalococcoidia bacterium]|nr:NADPH:quinone oxidoreductase family protein [Dehalococcoidia bacterium]
MKAVRIHELGDPSVLKYEDAPDPQPKPGEVLIKVEAVSMNFADVGRRSGRYGGGTPTFPIALGLDGAGTITAVGEGVEDRSVGQRVAFFGPSYAEYTTIASGSTAKIPDGVSSEAAACVPVTFGTAWYCLKEATELKSTEHTLVQAGGSGVGTAAIQIAKYIAKDGGKVVTTAGSEEKCRKALELGADVAINYTTQDLVEEAKKATGGKGVDVVLESVGGEVYKKSLEAMAPGGRLVSIGRTGGEVPEVGQDYLSQRGISAIRFGFGTLRNERMVEVRGQIEMLMMLIKMGLFKVVIDSTYPLSEAAAAHRHLEDRKAFGKVVLIP